jgi:mono/diheme cytochrome c family protein
MLLWSRNITDGDLMFRFVRPVLASLTIAGVAATMNEPTHAAGNAQRGKQIAEAWCAQCHDVAPGAERFDNNLPATFQEVADTPGMGELALKVFFQTPHRQMPDFSLTNDVRDDLIAYITSLKR